MPTRAVDVCLSTSARCTDPTTPPPHQTGTSELARVRNARRIADTQTPRRLAPRNAGTRARRRDLVGGVPAPPRECLQRKLSRRAPRTPLERANQAFTYAGQISSGGYVSRRWILRVVDGDHRGRYGRRLWLAGQTGRSRRRVARDDHLISVRAPSRAGDTEPPRPLQGREGLHDRRPVQTGPRREPGNARPGSSGPSRRVRVHGNQNQLLGRRKA